MSAKIKTSPVRDSKGRFISGKKPVVAAVKKKELVVKRVYDTKQIKTTNTSRLVNTNLKPSDTQKQVLYLWVDEKNMFRISTDPQTTGLMKSVTALPLHDPKVNIISLKRAIRDAETKYNIGNGITMSE